jgi:transposase
LRPTSVYANPSCPAGTGCPCDVARLLHGPHRVATRLVMILLSQRGWPASTIAELLGTDPSTVRRWIHRYNTQGVTGLADRPRSGRPRLGSPRLAQRILLLAGDPNRDQVLMILRQQLTALPDDAVVLAEDETHVNLLPWVPATWIAHGQRQLVMTPGTNRRRTIFGAVDVRTGQWFYQGARKAVSATFTAFCEHLLAANPAAPVVAVVCDNVIIHRSKLVQAWLAAHPRLIVLHGARYSPHDNPVERIWAALKAWLANAPTLTIQGRIRQVHAFFRARSPAQLLATAAPSSSPWLPERSHRELGRTADDHRQLLDALHGSPEQARAELTAHLQVGAAELQRLLELLAQRKELAHRKEGAAPRG